MKFNDFSSRERLLMRISGTLCIVAVSVWAWLIFSPLASGKTKPKKGESKIIWVKPDPARVQARLTEVNQLREKMRPWATKNRDSINRMRAGDEKAFRKVYEAIPVHADANVIGISSQDVMEFTWNCHVEKSLRTPSGDSLDQKRQASSVKLGEALLNSNWEKYHDIEIADSTLPGRMNYVLWASGRITEVYELESCRSLACFTDRPHKEIAPPL